MTLKNRIAKIGWFLLMFWTGAVGAADFTSVKSGQWFDASTWLPMGYPLGGDNAIIINGNTVALSFSNSLNLAINDLDLSNGTVSISTASGQGTFAIAGGGSMWTNGTLSGPLTQRGTLTLFGNNGLATGASLTNAGTIHQFGAGNLHPFECAIVNQPGATYDFAGDGTMTVGSVENDLSVFINQGTLLKSSGVNTSSVSIDFINESGTIEVDSGTLALPSAGGTSTNGTFIVGPSATLDLNGGGSVSWTGEITGSGAGQIALRGGSLNASSTLALDIPDGMFQWTGGNLGGTVTNLGVITLAGSNTMGCPGLLVNAGLLRQTNTANLNVSGPTIMNLRGATYDLEGDGNFVNGFYGGNVYNWGLFRKSSGTGVSSFGASSYFNYGGTLEVDSGTLKAAYSFIQTNGVTWLNGGNLSGGTLQFNGGSLTGYGTVTGTVINASAVVLPGTNGLGALNITGNYQQKGGGAFDSVLGGTNTGQFSQLNVSGGASLAGALNLSLAGGFSPSIGNQFQILSCSSRSGTFSLPPTFPTGMEISYSNSGAYLVVTGAVVFPAEFIPPTVSGNRFNFGFQTVGNQTYTVQRNDDLTTTNWVDFTNFTGDGSLKQFVTPTADVRQRFFRVKTQ